MLTPKQATFVAEYMVDLNGTQAAIRAGYSPRTADEQASRLLANVRIMAAVAQAREERAERTLVTVDMVVREYAKLGFSNIADVMSWDNGRVIVKPSSELSPEVLAAVASVKIKRRREVSPDGEKDWDVEELEVKMHDKQRPLDSLAKHLGMFPRQPLIEVNDNRTQTLTLQLVDDILRDADNLLD